MWYRILFAKNPDFKRRRNVLLPPKRIFWGNLLTRCYRILKLDKMRWFKRSEKSAQLTQCTHTQTTSRLPQVLIIQQPILTQNPLTFMLLYHRWELWSLFMIKFKQTVRKFDRISQLAMPFHRTSAVFWYEDSLPIFVRKQALKLALNWTVTQEVVNTKTSVTCFGWCR